MREIIRAPHSGFCFGVKNAIDMAVELAENNKDKKLFTYGPIIHNKMVTDDLKAKGIGIIESIDEASSGDIVIIRSHGVGENYYNEAEAKGLILYDATCPNVKKIHNIVKKEYLNKKQIVIVGDEKHPEVVGINGWCNGEAIVLSEPKHIKKENLFVVAQTTIKKSTFDNVLDMLIKDNESVEYKNTICNATSKRQNGCLETAKKVDVMLVIGDENSSNSRKLYEIAKKTCKKAYFITDILNLPLKDVQKYNRIGLAAGASTPEIAIKEVTTNMSDKITKEESMLDYMEEIEKSLRLPRGGELVTGKVHQVTDKEIIVNLGCKKDGIIPLNEITLEGDQKLTDLFSEGDEITAKVLKTDDGDGTILLSKKKLEASEHWEEINKALDDKALIDVTVVRQVNGGVIAAYKEVQGFIPLSQLSDKFVEDSSEFVGKTLSVKVSRVDARRGKAVFSHKAKLNEERQKALEEIWKSISVGDVVEGTVMRFTDYGAFVDIGGVDGLLHISEISWGKLKHPQEILEIGEKIHVKILSMNNEKGKISLGLKQTQPEPWTIIDEKYQIGQVVSGKVVQIKEYGCFVELEPGLDGLVHISEVNHKRVANINDELSIGEEVSAKILEIDRERKRISLSIKETLEAPAKEEAVEADAE
ncbi:MAG: bifunctional 4-hydroxy-3-methylbut-2-enyl diphosphate reductase/30S ribosomal protein S1 [Anaerovoracaceae bacterium]